MMMQQMKDYLRKLIKYEESLGVDVHQKDYFDNLYRKTTASFRAKLDSEEDIGLKKNGTCGRPKTSDRENNLRKKSVGLGEEIRQEHGGLLQQGPRGGVLRDHKQQQQPQRANTKQEASGCSKMTIASSKRREIKSAAENPTSTARSSRATGKSSNAMWIRPRSKTPHAVHHAGMDPVQLYQYYQHEWDKFKTNLPGECNRSELRWQIRHKLLGEQ